MADDVEPGEPDAAPGRVVIDTREQYLAAVEALAAGSGPFGVDAERASGFRYSQRAYLIQVYRDGAGSFLFDPPALLLSNGATDLAELAAVMAGEEWILHAASQDLACLREVGLDPERIFDTELGARLAGLPRVGLGAVVEELLGIHLRKEHSAADWSTRPLPDAWLEYAALDVELLPALRIKVGELLDAAGKTGIAEQEFAAELEREAPSRHDPWRRLSGVHTLRTQRALAVARELWRSRDDYAREIDTAPGRLVPDASLVAVARAMPKTKRELAALREFQGRASRSQLDRWWAAVEAGLATADLPAMRVAGDTLPPPRAWGDRNPPADARLRAARTAVGAVAAELDIPVENLLTPDYLRRVAWTPPEPLTADSVASALAALGARPWQRELLSPVIVDAFVAASQSDAAAPEAAS